MELLHNEFRDGELHVEDVPVRRIAEKVGTPTYVYSRDIIQQHVQRILETFQEVETLVCYSVKALANLAILQTLRDLGTGFDVASGGELFRVLQAGGRPKKIVFAGMGKSAEEIDYALDNRILMFNVESEPELRTIDVIASQKGVVANVALLVNPEVDPRTHPHIGIDLETADRLAAEIPTLSGVRMVGVHVHLGSQITEVRPHPEALAKAIAFADRAKGLSNPVEWINLECGFGIHYREGEAPSEQACADVLLPILQATGYRLAIEHGRFIVGSAGILVTRVLYVKGSGAHRLVICDAATNDLLHHEVWPVVSEVAKGSPEAEALSSPADVVGPACEPGDFLARDRMLPPLREGDLLAVFSAGAYGMTMAGNFGGRTRPAEVLVHGDLFDVVRTRETWDDLIRGERTIPRWD